MARGSVGSVLVSLPERRNRYVLYSLTEHTENAPVEVEVLAREVAAWEEGVPPESASDTAFEAVLDDLTGDRLPALSYRGLVEYDPLSGMVGRPQYSVVADAIVSLLGHVEIAFRF